MAKTEKGMETGVNGLFILLVWFVYISETGLQIRRLSSKFGENRKSTSWPLLKIV